MDKHSDLDDWELLSDSGDINGVVEASINSNYFSLNFTEPSETVVMQPELEEEKHEDPLPDPIFHVSNDHGPTLVDVQESRHGEPIKMVSDSEDVASIGEQSSLDCGIAEVFSTEDGVDLGGVDEELRSSEPEMVESGAEDGADLGGVDPELNSGEPEELEVEVEAEDGGCPYHSGSNGLPVAERENEGSVWWKAPMEMVKHCAHGMSPVWYLPVAATFFGLAVVGTKMYMMRHQNQSQSRQQSRSVIPLRVSMDQQKAYQVMVQAARLNEACTGTRRVPVIRSSQHHDGAISWPILPLT